MPLCWAHTQQHPRAQGELGSGAALFTLVDANSSSSFHCLMPSLPNCSTASQAPHMFCVTAAPSPAPGPSQHPSVLPLQGPAPAAHCTSALALPITGSTPLALPGQFILRALGHKLSAFRACPSSVCSEIAGTEALPSQHPQGQGPDLQSL